MAKKAGQRRPKKVPQRTCVVCKQKRDKRHLTRVVRTADAGVVIDQTGKRNGRGAYLCENSDCWEKAVTSGTLNRALKTELTEVERETILAARPPKTTVGP